MNSEKAGSERNRCGARTGSVSRGSGTGEKTARLPLRHKRRTNPIHYPLSRLFTKLYPPRAHRELYCPGMGPRAYHVSFSTTRQLKSTTPAPCPSFFSWSLLCTIDTYGVLCGTEKVLSALWMTGAVLQYLVFTARCRLRRTDG